MVRKALLLEDSLAIAKNIKNNMVKRELGTVSKRPQAVVETKRPIGQAGNQPVKKFRDGGNQHAPINRELCKHCDKPPSPCAASLTTSPEHNSCWRPEHAPLPPLVVAATAASLERNDRRGPRHAPTPPLSTAAAALLTLAVRHNSVMEAAAHTPGVSFGPLVVQDHIRNDYLTTPTRFEDFPPVVESPYFLGVIPVVLPTAAKTYEAKQAQEEPQAHEANLIKMFTTYVVNFVNASTAGKNKSRKPKRKPTTRGISSSGKTVRVGDLRIRLDESETTMIPERHVATIPVKNSFGILPKVRQHKPSFKVKNMKKQWMKAETRNHKFDNISFKKYKVNAEKNEIYSPPHIKEVWVTIEEAQEL
ncbi:hypothetical protein Taro_032273 [Colocasia esculenta]|uniref:Uncharacterized protein n=1 Tax=Colocasia esculenta TaxID=4460 RepID=A0A843VWX1_COLES|nr:hypothetical protein [Colocasia esculenta]